MGNKAVIQIVGYKNSGKTTAACEMIRRFTRSGWRVGSVKHDGHDFEADHPGRDSWRHREAGAQMVALASSTQTVLFQQTGIGLERLLERFEDVDIIIVEGYKHADYPKIVLLRGDNDNELLGQVSRVIGVFGPVPCTNLKYPVFDRNDYDKMFALITDTVTKKSGGDA